MIITTGSDLTRIEYAVAMLDKTGPPYTRRTAMTVPKRKPKARAISVTASVTHNPGSMYKTVSSMFIGKKRVEFRTTVKIFVPQ
jgi:hypothetical protein